MHPPTQRAAEQGCEASMNNLGYLYKRGGNGILRDMAESLYWFKRGAEAGDIYAMDNLGACYRDGVGVPIDLEVREAVHEFRDHSIAGSVPSFHTKQEETRIMRLRNL